MAGGRAGLLRHIQRLWDLGTFAGLTDAQLLSRFAARHEDGAEPAFEALVERHGPMVFRVCRGVLRDEHAAEDAFQATFLVLARKARSLWVKDSLGSWLHGVAHRVAARARSDATRRHRHERRLAEARGPAWEAMPDRPRSDGATILSEEIARLPEKYRAPIVLCYLEALSYEAAARRLGVSGDAVRGRLARARERLRARLIRRGVEIPAILEICRPSASETPIRTGLVQATARAAMGRGACGAPGSVAISRAVISLSERTCRTMMLTKLKAAAAALVLGVVAAGAVVSAQQTAGGRGEREAPAPTTRRPPRAASAGGGNLIVDWIPADGQGGKREIIVDPKRHSVHLPHGPTSLKRDDRLNDGMIHLDLERGKTYTVTASGEAFLSAQTGNDADPFAGVVVIYSTDEEDCFAERQIVLAPGKSITFRSPWLIDPKSEGYVKAFFLDTWPGAPKRGTYTLTVTESGEWADSKHARIYNAREDRRWDDATSRLILKQVGELDAAYTKRALDAARKPSGDPEVPASPAREASTGLPANSKP